MVIQNLGNDTSWQPNKSKCNQDKIKPKLFSGQKSLRLNYLMRMMLAIFYLSFIEQLSVQAQRCTLTFNDRTIGQSQTYKFTFFPRLRNSAQAYLRFHFTADSTITASSPSCVASDITQFTSLTPLCTATVDSSTGDTYIDVSDLQTGKTYYVVSISGVINAKSAKIVSDTTCKSSTAISFASIIDTATVPQEQYNHNVMPTSTATYSAFGSQINGDKESDYLIKVQLQNPLLAMGSVIMTLPKSNLKYMSHGTTFGYDFITNAYSLPRNYSVEVSYGSVGSSTETSIPLDSADPTYPEFQYNDFYSDTLKVKLANTAEIPINQEIRVKLTYVTNPPSINPLNTICLITGDKDFNYIDEVQNVEVATSLPNSFVSDASLDPPQVSLLEFNNGLTMVSATGVEYKFTVYLTNDIPRDGKLYVTFPTDGWVLTCPLTATDVLLYSVVSSEFADFQTANVGCSIVENRLELESGWPQNDNFLYAPGPLIFTLGGFDNPETTAEKHIKISSYNSDGGLYIIDQDDAPFFLTFDYGKITVTNVEPTDNVIYSSDGTYKFQMSFEHDFKSTYKLTIVLPAKLVVIQNSACIVTAGTSITTLMNTDVQCAAEATSQSIIIKDLFTADLPAGTTIDFEVDSIQNPGDFLDITDALKFYLTTASDGEVDQGEFTMGTDLFIGSYIETFQVEALDLVAGKQPVVYQFTVIPHARVPMGTTMKIQLPPEVIVTDRTRMSQSCANGVVKGFSHDTFSCSWDRGAATIEINNGFKYDESAGFPPTLVWRIDYFENPRSMATTGMFNISMYDSNQKMLYEYNNTYGPNLTMSEVRNPASFSLKRTSRQNGVMNNYTFQLKSNNYIEDGDILKFSIPSPVRFTDDSECHGVSYWMSGNLTCTKSGDRQTVQVVAKVQGRRQLSVFEEANKPWANHLRRLASNIPAGNKIDITFTNITSPYSLRPVNGSTVYSLTTAEGYTIETYSNDLNIVNKFLGNIDGATAGVSPDYFERNKTANYTLTFSPLNYEQNMQIIVYVPRTIDIPRRVNCTGLKGVDKPEINCVVNRYRNKITLTDALTEQTIRPKTVEWMISVMRNPEENILTSSFKYYTETYDGYGIDRITSGLKINFICIFPCKLCNEEIPTECYACYTATTPYIYLFNKECLETCPDGMYEVEANFTHPVPTCDFCKWPCLTCGTSAVQCLTCPEGYLLYDVESTCYEEIIYYFPFLCAAGFFFLVVLLVDCCKTSTNFTHSLLYFLCYLELGVHGFLIYLFLINRDNLQKTDRSFTIVSYVVNVFLNLVFAGVHCGIMLPNASPQYKQVFKEYKCTSWTVQTLAYLLNFKMSLMLVSSFGALPRFSGTFNNDSWQKFNLFSIFYILLCYLVFVADFYLYFTSNGLRKLTSFVAAEAVIIMTMISLILMFEILSQCACAGIQEQDLGRRAGLNMAKKNNAKKKRRALRSGMGNEEDSYDDEYDSEGSYFSEIEFPEDEQIKKVTPIPESEEEEEEYEDEYDEEEEADEQDEEDQLEAEVLAKRKTKVGIGKTKKGENPTDPGLDMLEDLAKQMAEEKARLKSEKEAILEEKERLLKEKEDYIKNAGSLKENMDEERERIKRELQEGIGDIMEEVDERIDNKLKQRDVNIFLKKKGPSIPVPPAVSELVIKEKEIDGDEEYWLQNATAIQEDVSNVSAVRERDASVIEFVQNESAQKSQINSVREMEDEQEMRANISAGPVMRDDVSANKSLHATEQNYINRESAVFKHDDGARERQTEQDYFEGASAVFSQIPDNVSKNATEQNFINRSIPDFGNVSNNTRVREGTEIDNVERRSAEFGDVSNINKSGSQIEALNRTPAEIDKMTNNTRALDGQTNEQILNATPLVDNHGHSEESDEGVVADHKPFDGIREAIANQEQYRKNIAGQQNPNTPDEVQNVNDSQEEEDEDNRPSARRRIKQVLYSDKSESSVDDMMEDTPSNYNIANGRLEGKSMGLKAILLFAKNQGVQLGQPGKGGQLPQIAEEAQQLNKSGEGNNWKPMNMPINTGRTQVVGEDVNRTMEADGSGMRQSKNTRSKRNPGVTKEFKEGPNEMGNLSGRGNQNLKNIQKNNYL